MKIPLSIVILTINEELNLPKCLDSIKWCDDLFVVDSGSTDKTVSIAKKAGAKCMYHPFESFGKQRNWALDNCKFKYYWILFLDADERITLKFKKEIHEAITNQSIAGFYCCCKMILNGTWLKRSGSFPNWQFRLLYTGKARFMDVGHGQKECQVKGEIGFIKEPYLHYPFNKGWHNWIDNHNKYSDEEAIYRLKNRVNLRKIFSKNSSIRNAALKPFVSRIPGWPLIYFIFNYFLKGGFLEGYPGLIYCINLSYCELLIKIKMKEPLYKKHL